MELEDIYTGNGVSELLCLALQALLGDGDEILLPSPDYSLWTAGVGLAGGRRFIIYAMNKQTGVRI